MVLESGLKTLHDYKQDKEEIKENTGITEQVELKTLCGYKWGEMVVFAALSVPQEIKEKNSQG